MEMAIGTIKATTDKLSVFSVFAEMSWRLTRLPLLSCLCLEIWRLLNTYVLVSVQPLKTVFWNVCCHGIILVLAHGVLVLVLVPSLNNTELMPNISNSNGYVCNFVFIWQLSNKMAFDLDICQVDLPWPSLNQVGQCHRSHSSRLVIGLGYTLR